MPLLVGADVERYTRGRVKQSDPETVRLIARGYAAARRFCGWHVTPIESDDVLTLDGPGGRLLRLPTLRLVIPPPLAIVEVGAALDAAEIEVSLSGLMRKRGGCWTDRLGGIQVTMTHGFDDAPDFDAAVLSWIDRMSCAPDGGRPKGVGPFQYDSEAMDPGSAFSVVERSLLEQYRLEAAP